MFTANLTINDHAAVAKTFNLVYQQGNETRRLDISSTAEEPRTMTIRHSTAGSGNKISDRHNVNFVTTVLDDQNNPVQVGGSVTLTVPRSGAVSDDAVYDHVAFVKNFFTDANVAMLLRGES